MCCVRSDQRRPASEYARPAARHGLRPETVPGGFQPKCDGAQTVRRQFAGLSRMVTPRDMDEVTDFRVFERPDGALVLVPSLFQLPQSLEDEGMLRPMGTVEVDIERLSRELVELIARNFYGVAHGADAELVRGKLAPSHRPSHA